MRNPVQGISLHAFDGNAATLMAALQREPINEILRDKDPYRQLRYIVDYLKYPQLGAKSYLLEEHYVDRDYMEDHAVFYSRSLRAYANYCKRVHFFNLPKAQVAEHIKSAAGLVPGADSVETTLSKAYLGFVVVKPIPGAPIGRTVLKHLPAEKGDGHLRSFRCVRDYDVHVLGLTLKVWGLAFQQQDEGVSACATTAVWSTLQKIRDFEDIRIATPAEITSLATRHILPFGRAMPSEGLSIDQMCQAIQALGLAPSLYRLGPADDLLAYLHAAEHSSFPCILVWDDPDDTTRRHAVAVVGVKTLPGSVVAVEGLTDLAREIRAIYVHDDRIGPYLRTDLENQNSGIFTVSYGNRSKPERWRASYLLLPVHGKIRLSLAFLRQASRQFATAVRKTLGQKDTTILSFESFIRQGHKYVKELCQDSTKEGHAGLGFKLVAECALPRYLGVIRVAAGNLGWIDLLLDTTSTPRSIECVAIVCHEQTSGALAAAASELAGQYACKAFTSQ